MPSPEATARREQAEAERSIQLLEEINASLAILVELARRSEGGDRPAAAPGGQPTPGARGPAGKFARKPTD